MRTVFLNFMLQSVRQIVEIKDLCNMEACLCDFNELCLVNHHLKIK